MSIAIEKIEEIYTHVYSLVMKDGQVMRDGYYGQKTVSKKSAFYDMVTEHDKQIEDLLINGIKGKYPDHKFIGEEESAEKKTESALTDEPTWIIDPIDGTTNFIKKIPHACISIALTLKKELVIGIVFNPMANELYTAKKGQGAFMNGQRIYASDCDKLNDAVIGYELSLIHAPSVRDKYIKRIYKISSKTRGTRSFGSAALALCYVANGSLDCYHVDDLKAWDIAAGALILQEAGAVIYHTTGKQLDIMKPDLVCASTDTLSKEIIGLIEEANNMTHVYFN